MVMESFITQDWFWHILRPMYFPHTFEDIRGSINLGKEAIFHYYAPSSKFSWAAKLQLYSIVKKLVWAPIAKYWYIIVFMKFDIGWDCVLLEYHPKSI